MLECGGNVGVSQFVCMRCWRGMRGMRTVSALGSQSGGGRAPRHTVLTLVRQGSVTGVVKTNDKYSLTIRGSIKLTPECKAERTVEMYPVKGNTNTLSTVLSLT